MFLWHFFSWTFDLLFINSSIDIYCLEFISHHIKEILCVNTNSKGNQSWNKNKEIYFYVFLKLKLKNPVFLSRVKTLSTIFKFSQFYHGFMNIFRSSRSQMFFNIRTLKNFAIFWIKESIQHRCFPVNIAKFFRTAFLQNFSGGCFCISLKVIKRLFCKGYFKSHF